LSALISGVAGVLSALNTGFVSPENLHWSLSGMTLMMVVVGGFKVLWGPALGAVVYFMFKDILGDYATHWMTIFWRSAHRCHCFFTHWYCWSDYG
jgi:branched-chain amino acid transport system permease protein